MKNNIFSLTFFLVINFIFCEAINKSLRSKNYRNKVVVPIPEYYAAIPVVILYDGNNKKVGTPKKETDKDKQEDKDERKTERPKENNPKTINEIIDTENMHSTVNPKLADTTENYYAKKIMELYKTDEIPKGYPTKERKVPVQIVFEPIPSKWQKYYENQDNHLRFTRDTVTKAKKIKTDEIAKTAISNVKNETHNEIKTHTFPKRSGAKPTVVPIIDSINVAYAKNNEYHYSYKGGDGTNAYHSGTFEQSAPNKTQSVNGGYSYQDETGQSISLTYTADERGFIPHGDHLPTPPPIPPEIARALKYLATKTTPQEDVETVTSSIKQSENNQASRKYLK